MTQLVTYEYEAPVASITMDDGKANALSTDMFAALGAAFDRAEADGGAVVLAGRDGMFSAGFDLKVLTAFGPEAPRMMRAGFELAHRMLAFPRPIVVACTGHAMAMGSFLLLSGDYRIGVRGAAHKVVANEVAIGLTMPYSALEILRQRLNRSHYDRAVNLAEEYTPDSAVQAGFLDAVVPPGELLDAARSKAVQLHGLDLRAHAATKRRSREATLAALQVAIEADDAEFKAFL
jgi:enoyl-CoA hydratase